MKTRTNKRAYPVGKYEQCDQCGKTTRKILQVGSEALCVECHDQTPPDECGCERCEEFVTGDKGWAYTPGTGEDGE